MLCYNNNSPKENEQGNSCFVASVWEYYAGSSSI